MRNALAALTLGVIAFVAGIFPALAFDDLFDPGYGVYDIPAPVLFGDSVYGTALSMGVTAIIGLLLIAAIIALVIMNRRDPKQK